MQLVHKGKIEKGIYKGFLKQLSRNRALLGSASFAATPA
jgi:hypothetical protein